MTGKLHRILTHRLGLHPRCNQRLGSGRLCGKDAAQWYVTDSWQPKMFQAHSYCSQHKYEEPYLKFLTNSKYNLKIFNSWGEVKVWEVMQS